LSFDYPSLQQATGKMIPWLPAAHLQSFNAISSAC
jgi:hypothetical protein